jgi:CBS-domain-containing membrane protein
MRRDIARELVRPTPVLHEDDSVPEAFRTLVESGLPGLPVLGEHDQLVGTFGHSEFLAAVMPAYFKALPHAGFVPKSLDDSLELRDACRAEVVGRHMVATVVRVPVEFSDAQVADAFLHNPTDVVTVVGEDRSVRGVITRADFVEELGGRFLRQ